ncbi:MAG: response regulator [Deltaproteobacteria bacterium]|nr:response regulator [Deltaproteobacteria bacterium]
MRIPPRILIVDDNPMNVDILQTRLAAHGYETVTASDGEEALAIAREKQPDLILLDIMMPKMDGMEVCRELKRDPTLPFMPIILVTAKSESKDIVAGLEAGGDEYLTKPVDQAALVARVKSMLRTKALYDQVQEQTARLEVQTAQLSEWNRALEQRVQDEVTKVERLGRLKRFFSPHLAELIIGGGAEDPLQPHRREVTSVFLDLRGFTAFAETTEPEEVMAVLQEYHAAMGQIVLDHEGTLEHFAGDGIMIFFNDPVPVPNPGEKAIRMALALRDKMGDLTVRWRKRGFDLSMGIGLAQGYATIGAIGFEARWEYGAIGTVMNLASRLCGEAKSGQILLPQRLLGMIEHLVDVEYVGELVLKGFHRPIKAYNVLGLKK